MFDITRKGQQGEKNVLHSCASPKMIVKDSGGEKKETCIASQTTQVCQADAEADYESVAASVCASRGVPRSNHGGADEERRQQPWPHHLWRLRQGWQAQGVKSTARWAGCQVRFGLCDYLLTVWQARRNVLTSPSTPTYEHVISSYTRRRVRSA